MKHFKFESIDVEYNEKFINSYPMAKAMTCADSHPEKFYSALERLYDGRDEEYSEQLGYDDEKMLELVRATFEDAGKDAKN